MRPEDYIEANRRSWNETAEIHRGARLDELLERIREPDFVSLDETARALLERVGLRGKRVVMAPSNNARELISMLRLGARAGLAVDVSEAFVDQGRELARAAGVEDRVELLAAPVQEIPREHEASFDLCLVTVGSLGWMPDLREYWSALARLLAPGGHLVVYEMHPLLDMFEDETLHEPKHSYFEFTPQVCADDPDYFDPTQRVQSTSYWFHHTLSDVIGGCIDAGLRIEEFEEHAHDISNIFGRLGETELRPPMCYTLVARREG